VIVRANDQRDKYEYLFHLRKSEFHEITFRTTSRKFLQKFRAEASLKLLAWHNRVSFIGYCISDHDNESTCHLQQCFIFGDLRRIQNQKPRRVEPVRLQQVCGVLAASLTDALAGRREGAKLLFEVLHDKFVLGHQNLFFRDVRKVLPVLGHGG